MVLNTGETLLDELGSLKLSLIFPSERSHVKDLVPLSASLLYGFESSSLPSNKF